MSIKIIKKTTTQIFELDYKSFIFNGGEVSIKLDSFNYFFFAVKAPITLVSRIQNSNDFFVLANIKNALEELDHHDIELFLPYLSYSRQDRVCASGESFSLKVFANLLNSLNFKKVTTLDCHSDVGTALINNVKHIKQLDIIAKTPINELFICPKLLFVSPDAGSNKKTSELAKYYGHDKFIRADKLRELTTGKILETIVYADNLNGYTVAICDDLADFGGTFCALAKVLKGKGAAKVILFVTHGIFAGGFDKLIESGIDEIITTNSFRDDIVETNNVKVFNIEEFAK